MAHTWHYPHSIINHVRYQILTPLLATVLLLLPGSVSAAPAPNIEKGLLITPLRQFLSADTGGMVQSSFSVTNQTDGPLDIDLKVEQFSVTDYYYNYTFSQPSSTWVHLSIPSVTLQSRQTQKIAYTVQVPAGTAPGGHYYTLLASATLTSGSVKNTIQAADLLYLTVGGKLTTVSHLESSFIRKVNFGHDIPFALNPINTGNVYSFVYVSGELHGLFVEPPRTSAAHMLLPGHVRTLNDSIPSPVLPGVYRATYGYKTEGNWIVQQSRWIVYIPPWFIAVLLALILVLPRFLPRLRQKKAAGSETTKG
jgi:hypothetical protein